jgi:hypothetical protein
LSKAAHKRGTTTGHDFMPSRKHSQEHFSTDSTARKPNYK